MKYDNIVANDRNKSTGSDNVDRADASHHKTQAISSTTDDRSNCENRKSIYPKRITHDNKDSIHSPLYLNGKELPQPQVCEQELPQLPDFGGRTVAFIPDAPELSKKSGKFLIDNTEYIGVLNNIKTSNDRKKAKKYKGKIPAIIQGNPQSGKYTLKMK